MKKVLELLIVLLLIMLFLSGTLYTTNNWRILQPYFLLSSTTMIYILNIVYKTYKFKADIKLLIIFFLFILSSLLSTLLNSDFELFLGVLLLIYIYISLVIGLPSLVYKIGKNGQDILAFSLLIGHIPVIIIPIIIYGFENRSYVGIFYNPNSFGTVVVTLFIIALSKVLFNLEKYIIGEKNKKWEFIFFLFLSILMLWLTVISSSRTSFLAAAILIVISFLFLINQIIVHKKIKLKQAIRFSKLVFFIVLIMIGIFFYTSFSDIFYESIVNKFIRKSSDLLDGRLSIWIVTIKEAELFGHGREYFSKFGLGAHNTFISILGQYGIIAVISFLIFLFKLIIEAFNYTKTNNDYKYLPFFAVCLFIILSMGEGMMLKTIMLLMFSTIGFINKNLTVK